MIGINPLVYVLGLGFLLNFSAYSPTQNFMTVNFGDTGTIALGLLYVVFAIFTLLSPFIIERLGDPRNTLVFACVTYIAFVAGAFSDSTIFIYLGSSLCGIGAGILWPVSGIIVGLISTSETRGRTAGIFYTCARTANIAGNALAGVLVAEKVSNSLFYFVLLMINIVAFGVFLIFRYGVSLPHHDKENTEDVPNNSNFINSFCSKLKNVFGAFLYPNVKPFLMLQLAVGFSKAWLATSFTVFVSKEYLGLLMSIYGGTLVLGNVGFGALFDKAANKKSLVYVWLTLLSCTLALALIADAAKMNKRGTLWYIFLASFAVLFGAAISCAETCMVAFFTLLFKDRSELSNVFAQRSFLESGGFAVITLLRILDITYRAQLVLLCVVSFIALIIFWKWNVPPSNDKKPENFLLVELDTGSSTPPGQMSQ